MRVVIITGASDGIGAEMARQLAHDGGREIALVLAARNEQMLIAVAGQCESLGATVLVAPTDVSVQAQCLRLVATTIERFGRIDALINNAGKSAHANFEDVQDLGWYEELMRINLWGSVWCTHAALPHLIATKGSIVAVSSLAGLVGVPGRSAYGATKFAMTGFFEALRAEMKPRGVSVTTAYPGVVATKIRHHGFNAQGTALGHSSLKDDNAMPVEECARLIIDGMNGRKREVVMTAKGKVGRFMKLIAPGLVERMALAAVAEEPQKHS
jgi:short-subunit dehydrogenase